MSTKQGEKIARIIQKHFSKKIQAVRLNFSKHANFIINDKSVNVNCTKDLLRERLKQRESFWTQELEH